uniref:Zgc:109965 n=1 Tax=Salmo trutta TaxID=8032 RepID=A0A673XE03_SALTR
MLMRMLSRAAALLLLCVQLLHAYTLPAVSSYEFTAEALSADEPVLARRCVVTKLPDFTMTQKLGVLRQSAATVLILLPKKHGFGVRSVLISITWEYTTICGFMVSESEALLQSTIIPVYATTEEEQLLYMSEEVKHATATRTSYILVRVYRSMVTATLFQILVSNTKPIKPITDNTIITLEGVLPGAGEDVPTIVISQHHTVGCHGADSNGSGVTVLLELVRLFQKLYNNPHSQLRMVHKKINLGESTVAWEHARYAMRRIPGFTLSHLEDPEAELEGSILDTEWQSSVVFWGRITTVYQMHVTQDFPS